MNLDQYRYFLKGLHKENHRFFQNRPECGVKAPPIEKQYSTDSKKIELITANWDELFNINLSKAIKNRQSRRNYNSDPLTILELSFLLWATQGVRHYAGNYTFRNVPSAGCRHALETYLAVFNVERDESGEKLEPGIYRYLPLTHELLFEFSEDHLQEKMIKATFSQIFAGKSAVTFIWSAIPYRMEWRYGLDSHKVIAMDAGHVGQNMYLACEAIGAGTCAIGAYDQEYLDDLLRLDGKDEFAIYLAPVGKVDG